MERFSPLRNIWNRVREFTRAATTKQVLRRHVGLTCVPFKLYAGMMLGGGCSQASQTLALFQIQHGLLVRVATAGSGKSHGGLGASGGRERWLRRTHLSQHRMHLQKTTKRLPSVSGDPGTAARSRRGFRRGHGAGASGVADPAGLEPGVVRHRTLAVYPPGYGEESVIALYFSI